MAAAADASRSKTTLWQWVRHHLAAVASTIVDYSIMVTCVEALGLRPVPATLVGAFAGAVTSFTLGRVFIYHASEEHVGAQTWRYVLVAAASLALNAGGEHLFSDMLGMQYLLARFITSIIVSNAWNYPLQRFFVFSHRRPRQNQEARPPT